MIAEISTLPGQAPTSTSIFSKEAEPQGGSSAEMLCLLFQSLEREVTSFAGTRDSA